MTELAPKCCTIRGIDRALDEFYVDNTTGRRNLRCKSCHRDWHRARHVLPATSATRRDPVARNARVSAELLASTAGRVCAGCGMAMPAARIATDAKPPSVRTREPRPATRWADGGGRLRRDAAPPDPSAEGGAAQRERL